MPRDPQEIYPVPDTPTGVAVIPARARPLMTTLSGDFIIYKTACRMFVILEPVNDRCGWNPASFC